MATNPALDHEFITVGPGYVDIVAPKDLWHSWPSTEADYSSETIYTALRKVAEARPQKDFLGWREPPAQGQRRWSPYRYLSYSAACDAIDDVGSALVHLGMARGDFGAILANNCPEWVLCEFAMFRQGMTTVPLYPTYGRHALTYILDQTELRVAFVSRAMLQVLVEAVEAQDEKKRVLRVAVDMTGGPSLASAAAPLDAALAQRAAAVGLRLVLWDEVARMGRERRAPATPGAPSDVHSVIYTSGTTGSPKGAVTTHSAVLHTTTKVMGHACIGEDPSLNAHFSYLPLAHVFERAIMGSAIRGGATIGFSCGSLPLLLDDIAEFKPTYLIGVPRVWKRIYDKVSQVVAESGFLKRSLFQYAMWSKGCAENGSWSLINWDRVVFGRMAEKLGGRCKFILSGAAPLKEELSTWMSRCFCIEVLQSYGLTETFGGVVASAPPFNRSSPASVGHACMFSTVRLVDTPELNYLTTNERPAGEIWLRGEGTMAGYYKDPEATAAAVTPDGWFKTGDIACVNADGTVTVIDRVKNLFKLAQGEYVPAEYIETLLSSCKLVAQVWVHGDSTENFIIAFAVPNFESLCPALSAGPAAALARRCEEDKYQGPAAQELCDTPEARALVLGEFERISKEANLPGFQWVRGLGLEADAWTVENGLATPTFKLKRPLMRERFKSKIEALVAEVKSKQ
eukprot:m51a1_g4345 putative fatty acyl- synthetase (684) ;mRNA; f:200689-203479